MDYREIATDDVDQLFAWETGWDGDFLQLTRGRLGYRGIRIAVPGLTLQWSSFGQSVLARQVVVRSSLVMGVALGASCGVLCRGHDVNTEHAVVVSTGETHGLRLAKSTRILSIGVGPQALNKLDVELPRQPVLPLSGDLRQRLVNLSDAARIRMTETATSQKAVTDRELQALVIGAVRDVIAQRPSPDDDALESSEGGRKFSLFKTAEASLEALAHEESLDVGLLAKSLGTSERTVYASFQHCVGLGPYEYHLLCKLHRFQRSIVTGASYRGKISEAARASGFQHMGRLAGMYKRHFGETPRDTLQRRQREHQE